MGDESRTTFEQHYRRQAKRADQEQLAAFAAIFIAIGAVSGILSGHSLVIGALAGALLFGLFYGVGRIGNLGSPRRR